MIVPTFVLAVLLAGCVSAEQQQQPQVVGGEVSNAQPVPVQVVSQPAHSVVVSSQEEPQHVVGPIEHHQVAHHQHVQHAHQAHQQYPQQPQYYSPSGVIQVVGQGEQSQYKPQQPILKQYASGAPAGVPAPSGAGPEQYGQPESASIPPNYKPFGSWGLYIGGNPADGYYSSYYKALGQSVSDKQQQVTGASESVKPASPQAVVSQASGFSAGGQSPLLKQGSFPYTYQDQGYPYDSYYTPADLNSGSRVSVAPQGYPAQFGPSVFNYVEQPAVSGLSYAAMPDSYSGSTKRLGGAAPTPSYVATKSRDVQVPATPAKGYQQHQQQAVYSYAAGSPLVYQQPGQVVAYPVPVGSQIVGSQPGVEGSSEPYGVHGFTRYAIKPTVVYSQPAAPVQPLHAYNPRPVVKPDSRAYALTQPLSFYGYPLSQLHYSQGSLAPTFESHGVESSGPSAASPAGVQHPQQLGGIANEQSAPVAHSPLGYPSMEAASSDKSEQQAINKPAVNKPGQQ